MMHIDISANKKLQQQKQKQWDYLFDILLFGLVIIQNVKELLIDFRLTLKSILEDKGKFNTQTLMFWINKIRYC